MKTLPLHWFPRASRLVVSVGAASAARAALGTMLVSACLLPTLSAQARTESGVEAQARNYLGSLATAAPRDQLEVIARLGRLDIDEAMARRIRLAAGLSVALRGPADVEAAAAKVLFRCRDRSGASKVLVQHTAYLRTRWMGLPRGEWPRPELDPGMLGWGYVPNDPQRELAQQEEWERRRSVADAILATSRGKYDDAIRAAWRKEQEWEREGNRLAAFIQLCSGHHDDALVDEWLRALPVSWDHQPLSTSPIVIALCKSRRRDAVERSLGFLADPGGVSYRFLRWDLRHRFHADLVRGVGLSPMEGWVCTLQSSIDFLKVVSEQIDEIGGELGIRTPGCTARQQMLTDHLTVEVTRAWRRWAEQALPKLPRRLRDRS